MRSKLCGILKLSQSQEEIRKKTSFFKKLFFHLPPLLPLLMYSANKRKYLKTRDETKTHMHRNVQTFSPFTHLFIHKHVQKASLQAKHYNRI